MVSFSEWFSNWFNNQLQLKEVYTNISLLALFNFIFAGVVFFKFQNYTKPLLVATFLFLGVYTLACIGVLYIVMKDYKKIVDVKQTSTVESKNGSDKKK